MLEFLTKRFKHREETVGNYLDYAVFLVRLPKNNLNFNSPDDLRSEIAKTERIFSSIGGLKSQDGNLRDDHFSFEIVMKGGRIYFYIVALESRIDYIVEQVRTAYPEAAVERVKDYNVFSPFGQVVSGYLKPKKHFVFPINTYKLSDYNQLATVMGVLSKIGVDEGMALQFVVRSSKSDWHLASNRAAQLIKDGEIDKVESAVAKNGVWSFLTEVVESARPEPIVKIGRDLTEVEKRLLNDVEGKNLKVGLDVNLRLVVSASNKVQAKIYFDEVVDAFSGFDYAYSNSFVGKELLDQAQESSLVGDFIYRRFSDSQSFIMNTEELASIYHLPLSDVDIPNVFWLNSRHLLAPDNISREGLFLGENIHSGGKRDIYIKRLDRRSHFYVIGDKGNGKNSFIANMAIQDILNGSCVFLIDSHGDIISKVLDRISPDRVESTILLSLSDYERPMSFNFLSYSNDEEKASNGNFLAAAMVKICGLKSVEERLILENCVRLAVYILYSRLSQPSLLDLLHFWSDENYRRDLMLGCDNMEAVKFWNNDIANADNSEKIRWVLSLAISKMTEILTDPVLRPILSLRNGGLNFNKIIESNQVFLLDLSRSSTSEKMSDVLGVLLVNKILSLTSVRTVSRDGRFSDFYLYLNSFHRFVINNIGDFFKTDNEHGLNLILANERLSQLSGEDGLAIKNSIIKNFGNFAAFKMPASDADELQALFQPEVNSFDLANVEKYAAYLKLSVDGKKTQAFSIKAIWPLPGIKRDGILSKIKSLSRLRYGRDRGVVNAEIDKEQNYSL